MISVTFVRVSQLPSTPAYTKQVKKEDNQYFFSFLQEYQIFAFLINWIAYIFFIVFFIFLFLVYSQLYFSYFNINEKIYQNFFNKEVSLNISKLLAETKNNLFEYIINFTSNQDQPNLRLHSHDIFREIGLLPWIKCEFVKPVNLSLFFFKSWIHKFSTMYIKILTEIML